MMRFFVFLFLFFTLTQQLLFLDRLKTRLSSKTQEKFKHACQEQNVAYIKRYLRKHQISHESEQQILSCLNDVIQSQHPNPKILQLLLQTQVLSLPSKELNDALLKSIKMNHTEAVLILLSSNHVLKYGRKEVGQKAVQYAIENGNMEILNKLLIDERIDINDSLVVLE